MTTAADELVGRYILYLFRLDTGWPDQRNKHLVTCSDAVAVDVEAYNSVYGCTTGCEYARLEAVISCPHGESDEFDYGEFGDIANILEDIEDWERRECPSSPSTSP